MGTGTDYPGKQSHHQEALGLYLHMYGLDFEYLYMELGIVFYNTFEFLPTQGILLFTTFHQPTSPAYVSPSGQQNSLVYVPHLTVLCLLQTR